MSREAGLTVEIVTCEQLGLILRKWEIEASKDPLGGIDVGEMSENEKRKLRDEIVILQRFAITYAVQQQVTDPEVNQSILDSYHVHLYEYMVHTGMETTEVESFEKTLNDRYKTYYNALNKDSEARRTGEIPWHVGKTAAEHALKNSQDPRLIIGLVIAFGSTFKATKGLLRKYNILSDKKNGRE